jgi:hypothetical protein
MKRSMKTALNTFLIAVSVLAIAAQASADESVGHSLYKVTTYNLGTSLDFQDFSSINSQKRFDPLLITSTKADILGSDQLDDPLHESFNKSATDGFAIAAQYSPSAKFACRESWASPRTILIRILQSTNPSWEANLSVIYKMFKNFSYGVHFGYMDTGDLFKERDALKDVESIIMISNQLTMSF